MTRLNLTHDEIFALYKILRRLRWIIPASLAEKALRAYMRSLKSLRSRA